MLCINPELIGERFEVLPCSAQFYPLYPTLFSLMLELEIPDSLFRC